MQVTGPVSVPNNSNAELLVGSRLQRHMITRIRKALLCLAMVSAVACQTPPDVTPFADATAALDLSVHATERSVTAEIAAFDTTQADTFRSAWEKRLTVMRAMSEYSSSLVAIVQAARDSGETVKGVFDSVEKLFTTVGAVYPTGQVANALTSGTVAAYRAYANDRAAKTVSDALKVAAPAVQTVAEALAADFATLQGTLRSLRRAAITDYVTKQKQSNALIGSVQGLMNKFETLNGQIADDSTDASLLDAANALASLIESERALPVYAEYEAGLKSIGERFDGHMALARTAADTAGAWGDAHRALILAAEGRAAGGFQNLVALSQELLEIYNATRRTP